MEAISGSTSTKKSHDDQLIFRKAEMMKHDTPYWLKLSEGGRGADRKSSQWAANDFNQGVP